MLPLIYIFVFLILIALNRSSKVKKSKRIKKLMLAADLVILLAVLIWVLSKLKEKNILIWP